jgi:hypothetical protein
MLVKRLKGVRQQGGADIPVCHKIRSQQGGADIPVCHKIRRQQGGADIPVCHVAADRNVCATLSKPQTGPAYVTTTARQDVCATLSQKKRAAPKHRTPDASFSSL